MLVYVTTKVLAIATTMNVAITSIIRIVGTRVAPVVDCYCWE